MFTSTWGLQRTVGGLTFEIEQQSCSLQTNWDAHHAWPWGTGVRKQIHLVKNKQIYLDKNKHIFLVNNLKLILLKTNNFIFLKANNFNFILLKTKKFIVLSDGFGWLCQKFFKYPCAALDPPPPTCSVITQPTQQTNIWTIFP